MKRVHPVIPWTQDSLVKEGRTKIEQDLASLLIPSEIKAFAIKQIVVPNDGSNIAKTLYLLGENIKSIKSDEDKWFLRLALRDSLGSLYATAFRDYCNPITLAAIFFKMAAELNSNIGEINEDEIEIEYQYRE